MQADAVAAAMAFAEGAVNAVFIARLQRSLRAWAEQRDAALPLHAIAGLPSTPAEYRRQARDVLLGALALELAPRAGPGTQARRVAAYLQTGGKRADPSSRYCTRAERIAASIARLGEPVPGERRLRSVFASISATEAPRDFRNAWSGRDGHEQCGHPD